MLEQKRQLICHAGNPVSGLSAKNPKSRKGVKFSSSTFHLWTSLLCVLPWYSCQGRAAILTVQQPSLQTTCLSYVLPPPCSAGSQSEPESRGNAVILVQRLNKSSAISCLKANTHTKKLQENSGQFKWYKKSGCGRGRLFVTCCKMSHSEKLSKSSRCNTKKNATECIKQWVKACLE